MRISWMFPDIIGSLEDIGLLATIVGLIERVQKQTDGFRFVACFGNGLLAQSRR